jgi:L,D-peptidoglycan transpeptidase YkuD (ErfK/YbiS/YcfS/YnhG family)/nucleotide-binding universal stress UspA family protein
MAGLAAAVLGVCGCAAAGSAQVQAPASSAAPGALVAISSAARPAAVSAARRGSGQLVTVIAASYGATRAELTAYRRVGGKWRRVFGPWTAWIGRDGMAPPGAKREGDGRTPSGTFGFGFFFGVDPDPGVHFPYRRIDAFDVWDDDPSSPLYNEWVDDRYADPGAAPEPMDVSAYDYGAVIAYNTARTPGLGSAIFLHLNIGTPTAGCVTLPPGELLAILRWLDPAASPRITMGVGRLARRGGHNDLVGSPDFELGTDGPSLIMVGVDGSRTSLRAAAYAAGLARRQHCRLLAVYVARVPAGAAAAGGAAVMSETFEEVADELKELMFSRTAESGITAEFRSVRGDPLAELTRIAEQEHADAVVVGASEHLGHRIVGSLAARLVRSGKWPVTVVP